MLWVKGNLKMGTFIGSEGNLLGHLFLLFFPLGCLETEKGLDFLIFCLGAI